MKKSPIAIFILLGLSTITIFATAFSVRETEQALVLQFGEPRAVITEPGLNFKIPFIQNIRFFDKRVLDFDAPAMEIPTSDQKQVVVDAFARYRIVDPLKFYQTSNTELQMQSRLSSIMNQALRNEFGSVSLDVVMTPKRAELMRKFTGRVASLSKGFGIDVIDVRIKRIDLPVENSQAIFRRMQTQREQEARKFRAEGDKESRRIKADADKNQRVIVANAKKQAEILRGEGEATAQATYNDAYGRDPEFFDFWRSMQAMQKGLNAKSTSYVGATKGEFFRYFENINGGE